MRDRKGQLRTPVDIVSGLTKVDSDNFEQSRLELRKKLAEAELAHGLLSRGASCGNSISLCPSEIVSLGA